MYFFIFFVTVLFTLTFITLIKRNQNVSNFPEPPGNFFLGHIFEKVSSITFLNLFIKLTGTHRTIQLRVGPKVAPFMKVIVTKDYKLAEFILNQNRHVEKSQNYRYAAPWFGLKSINSEGPLYKQGRKVLMIASQTQGFKRNLKTFESVGNTLVAKLDRLHNSDSFDIYPLLCTCFLDITSEALLGTKLEFQEGKHQSYLNSVREMGRIVIERSFSLLKAFDWSFILTKDFYVQKEALKVIHGLSSHIVHNNQYELENNVETLYRNKTFLELLQSSNKKYTVEEIREIVDSIMFGGSYTTSIAASFALFSLANHPEIQDKVWNEQKELFGEETNSLLEFEHLQNMKYLDMVIKETLRLYPSGSVVGKFVKEDMFFNGQIIPKNTNLIIFIYGMHRDPEYFPDPCRFQPERFTALLPSAYMPFSDGPSSCIGQKFALMVMKSIISKVIRRFELFPASPIHKPQLAVQPLLTSLNGVRIGFKKRL